MRADERERAVEDLQDYRCDICAKIDALIDVLHFDDFEEEREALESETNYFRTYVQNLGPRTPAQLAEDYADECVNEMRNG